jgi:hypothetical protein
MRSDRRFVVPAVWTAVALFAVSCGTGPSTPTSPSSGLIPIGSADANAIGFGQLATSGMPDLASCLREPSPACFSAAVSRQPSRIGIRAVSAPINLSSNVAGATVTIAWTAPAGHQRPSRDLLRASARNRFDVDRSAVQRGRDRCRRERMRRARYAIRVDDHVECRRHSEHSLGSRIRCANVVRPRSRQRPRFGQSRQRRCWPDDDVYRDGCRSGNVLRTGPREKRVRSECARERNRCDCGCCPHAWRAALGYT